MSLKSAIKRIVPPPIMQSVSDWRSLSPDARDWRLNYKAWKSIIRMQDLRSKGPLKKRCFIIGNGPSLKSTDLSKLQNEATFGMNRIYLMFDQIGFSTTYYVAINQLVIEQCAGEITQLKCPKFLNWKSRTQVPFTGSTMFITSSDGPAFYQDITKGIWEGATVTYVALQIAFFLGYQQVILIGVDHSFSTTGKPHTVVVSDGDDPNHFNPEYFGKGFKWQLPDLETSELAYRIARFKYESSGRQILDATVGGNLKIFEKVEYDSLFS